ncbi:MAG: ATP-binding protein, partial [Gammaproteobacteria bacterium]|nr:ATP-binding protein [Gammaproteobacteria bacterium]
MSRRKTYRFNCAKTTTDIEPAILLWVYRILIKLNVHSEFVDQHGVNHDGLSQLLNIDATCTDFDLKSVRSQLNRNYKKAEKFSEETHYASSLRTNISRLAELVGLNDTDSRILEFAIFIHTEPFLDEIADGIGKLSSLKLYRILSVILGIPLFDIRASLCSNGLLSRSGLLAIEHSTCQLSCKLNLLSEHFADTMQSSEADPVHLLRGTVSPASTGELRLEHYSHIQSSLNILLPYLATAMINGRRGVNILLHGEPGTGKSQLVRALAKELSYELFEVSSENSQGEPMAGKHRLRSYSAAQCFFAKHRALIVFDEIEDVFNDGCNFLGLNSTAQTHKAWVNRMLEDSSLPTFWLSNCIEGMDRAFIRRFDMIIELPVPTRNQREKILTQECSDLIDSSTISRIAESESLAPAVVTRAASVVRCIRGELGEGPSAKAFEQIISSTLKAQGHKPSRKNDANRLPEVYDPYFINADSDLAAIATGIIRSGAGRLCLFGPPGTGKTAFGRWLATKMDVPLIVKRASDLVSP